MISIAFINKKGGCGKTTLTCLLALYWAEKLQLSVAIQDLDAQQSSHAFVDMMDHPKISHYAANSDADIVLIDTLGGIRSNDLVAVQKVADLVIIPMSLSAQDVNSTKETASALDHTENVRLIFNRIKTSTSSFQSRDLLANAIGIRSMKSYLVNRVAYTYAVAGGWNHLEGKKGGDEIAQLAKEIERYAGIKTQVSAQ